MVKNLYVGNMSYDTTEESLRELFGEFGEVTSVNVITDRATGRPRGFAFVEMATDESARAAIAALDGQDVDGRTLTVNEARPRAPRAGGPSGDRGGGRGGDRGGGRGGGRGGRGGDRGGGRGGRGGRGGDRDDDRDSW